MVDQTFINEIIIQGLQNAIRDFQAFGAAGEQAFGRLNTAADKASSSTGRFAPAVEGVKARFNDLSIAGGNVVNKLGEFGDAARHAVDRISLIGLAATGAAAGFVLLVKGAASAVENIGRSAEAAGIGAVKFQNLQFALGKSGVESDAVGMLFNRMNRTMGESKTKSLELQLAQTKLMEQFARGEITVDQFNQQFFDLTKEANRSVDIFNRLGISASTAFNDPREALLQIADKFQSMPRGIEKSALELELFGRAGTRMAVAMEDGRAGLIHLEEEGQRIAPAFQPAELMVGKRLTQAFFSLGAASENTKDRLLLTFAPGLTRLVNAFTEAIVSNRGALQNFANSIEAIIRPIVDDLVKLLEGKELDPEGFVSKARAALTQFASDVGQAIGLIVGAWNGLVKVLDIVANAINKIFGTSLTGQALALASAVGVVTGVFSALIAGVGLIVSVVGVLIAGFSALEIATVALGVAIGWVLGQLLLASLDQIPKKANAAWQALIDGARGTLANFAALFQGIADIASAAWQSITARANETWAALVLLTGTAWDQIAAFPGNAVNLMLLAFQTGISGIKQLFSDLVSFAQTQLLQIPIWLQSIIDLGTRAAQAISSIVSGGSSGIDPFAGFAGGGRIRGPGGPTDDRIPIWASNNEYMQPAAAVRKYGLAFMEAIRTLRFDPAGLFSVGGLVSFNMPQRDHFASGGSIVATAANRAKNILNLTIGTEQFNGMVVEDDTMGRLTRFATNQQVRSAGRKPSWKR